MSSDELSFIRSAADSALEASEVATAEKNAFCRSVSYFAHIRLSDAAELGPGPLRDDALEDADQLLERAISVASTNDLNVPLRDARQAIACALSDDVAPEAEVTADV